MSTYWTLAVGGTEKTLEHWGVCADFACQWTSKGKGTALLRTTEDFDPSSVQWAGPTVVSGPPPTVQLTKAIIYRDRTSSAGADNTFTAGTIYFQGYFDDPERVTSEGRENIHYRLHNVWWLFERNQFKQHRNQFASWDASHNRVLTAIPGGTQSGYVVGDTFEISGGTGTKALFTAVGVTAGAVTLLYTTNGGGRYSVDPTLSNTPTRLTGSGTGLTVTLTMAQAPVLVDKVLSEIYLGENLNAAGGYTSPFNTGGQIGEVIDWINECYNPTKRGATGGRDNTQDVVTKGTIDPNTFMPITRTNTVFCADAINACLRWEPDAVIQIDDSTTIPTINVRKLSTWNIATVPPTFTGFRTADISVTLTSDQEKQIRLSNAANRSLPGVVIYYWQYNINGGTVIPQLTVDKYPSTINDYTPEVSSHTIILAGSVTTYITATIQTTPISDAVSSTESDRISWWTAHDNTLKESRVTDIHVPAAADVKDDAGSAIDTGVYIYELINSVAGSWLPGSTIRANVSAIVTCKRWSDASHTIKDKETNNRVHTRGLKLITLPSGTYSQLSSVTTAEPIPQGVAESVYRSLAAVQYAGSVTFTEATLRTTPKVGQIYSLAGPNHTFALCVVQAVDTIPHSGYTTVTFGPSTPIDLDTWIDLARASRERTTWNFPSGRGDGGSSSAQSSSQAGGNPAGDDTAHGLGGFNLDVAQFTQP